MNPMLATTAEKNAALNSLVQRGLTKRLGPVIYVTTDDTYGDSVIRFDTSARARAVFGGEPAPYAAYHGPDLNIWGGSYGEAGLASLLERGLYVAVTDSAV